jgi:hypothetical protein
MVVRLRPSWFPSTIERCASSPLIIIIINIINITPAVLDAARLTDSNTLRPGTAYRDNKHFSAKSMVYHDLNMVLLAGLYGGDAFTPEKWEARFGAVGPYLRAAINRGSCGRRGVHNTTETAHTVIET